MFDKILYFLQEGATNVPVSPPSIPAATKAAETATASGGGGVLSVLLGIIYVFVSIALIVLVLIQTTKSEGLSGIIGGSSQSVFKGKKSFEEKLGTYTTYIAWGFLILSILVSFLMFK